MNIQTVQAYKCPHCSEISLDPDKIEKHRMTCRKNPEHVQKCSLCTCLNQDFLLTSLRGKGICVHTGPRGSGCPYSRHDDTEVMQKIQENHDAYVKFSCYSPDSSPQENWEKEDRYDALRKNGCPPEKAETEIYGSKIKSGSGRITV